MPMPRIPRVGADPGPMGGGGMAPQGGPGPMGQGVNNFDRGMGMGPGQQRPSFIPGNHPFFGNRFNRGFRGFYDNPIIWFGQRKMCWVWWIDQWMLYPCQPQVFGPWGGYGGWPNQSFSEWRWGAAPFYGY